MIGFLLEEMATWLRSVGRCAYETVAAYPACIAAGAKSHRNVSRAVPDTFRYMTPPLSGIRAHREYKRIQKAGKADTLRISKQT